ncbi:MAG: LLM class flavin-dependent oxidoreductase [Actinomycetota bacterium]
MRVGTSLTTNLAAPDPASGAAWLIERARAAHDAGLDSLSLGDHHAVRAPYYQNTPMLGRLLGEWTSGRPAGCLFLLPLWNPVLVAEHVGTLASLTDGPFVVQTGIGSGAGQFAAMGAELRTRGAMTDESIRVIKALLAGETVSSERFGIEDAAVDLVPRQPVEWWIGAGSGKPMQRAAREGTAWYGMPGLSVERTAQLIAEFREACAAAGNDHAEAIMRADVIVLQDDAAASARADQLIAAGYRGHRNRSAVIAGGAERMAEIFGAYAEVGVDEVVVRCMNVTQAEAVETLTVCGEVRRLLA